MSSDHTAELARHYDIPAQSQTESDTDFRHRVAGALRAAGKIIEAHEAQQNARWDAKGRAGESVQDGIMGALAQALQGNPYGNLEGVSQVGADIAAGVLVRDAPRKRAADAALLATLGMVGGDPSKLLPGGYPCGS